jgi:hypothetical protein
VITSTFENASDIGASPGLCLGPPAKTGVRSKRGAVQLTTSGLMKCFLKFTSRPFFGQSHDVSLSRSSFGKINGISARAEYHRPAVTLCSSWRLISALFKLKIKCLGAGKKICE